MFSAAAAATMSKFTALSEDANVSSVTKVQNFDGYLNPLNSSISPQQTQKIKKKRGLPGNPDPDAEVIALSPKTLLATNRFVCEVCNKGFQRDQNLQLHRRGHNLPWKLKQRNNKETRKKVYVCPEPSCVHHHPSRALGDLTGIKKHFCRKHGEKKWKCEKCSKTYAVQSDWKAHSKTCGTREYRCDCGTLFSRKDSFITHRAFCDALAQESARLSAANQLSPSLTNTNSTSQGLFPFPANLTPWNTLQNTNSDNPSAQNSVQAKAETRNFHIQFPPLSSFQETHIPQFKNLLHLTTQVSSNSATPAHLSATALLQKAAVVGATTAAQQPQSVGHMSYCRINQLDSVSRHLDWQKSERLTRDFLGLTDERCDKGNVTLNVTTNMSDMLTYAGGLEFQQPLMKNQDFGFEPDSETWGNS